MKNSPQRAQKDTEKSEHEFLSSHNVPIISETFVLRDGANINRPCSFLDGDLRLRHRQKLLAHLLKAGSQSFNLPLLSRDHRF